MGETVIIGERAHCADTAHWAVEWDVAPLRSVILCPAFVDGPTKSKLDAMFPHESRRVNLLWPSPVPGDWDSCRAAMVADRVRCWIIDTGRQAVLLGRKVAKAFSVEGPFFSSGASDLMPYLLLPHPSGRSRVLNDRAAWHKMCHAVEEFIYAFHVLSLVAGDAKSFLDNGDAGSRAALAESVDAWERGENLDMEDFCK
jgi:hypothetical protein